MFRRGREPKAPKDPAPLTVPEDATKQSRSPLRRLRLHVHRSPERPSSSSQSTGKPRCDLESASDLLSVSSDLSKTPSRVSDAGDKVTQGTQSGCGDEPEKLSAVEAHIVLPQVPESIRDPVDIITRHLSRPISGLWDEAYLCLSKQDPALVQAYHECLTAFPLGRAVAVPEYDSTASFFGMSKVEFHQKMLQAIRLKTQGNEARRWKVNFRKHELAVKDMIKPVVGIIEWAKDYVGAALESSAVASAAWAGVCLILPLFLNPGKQGEERLKALSHVTLLLSQCKMREELYKRRYENEENAGFDTQSSGEHHEAYKDSIRDLYMKILAFLATCSVYLSKDTVHRLARSVVDWDGWKDLNDSILTQEKEMLEIEARFETLRLQEEWEKGQDWGRRMLAEEHALAEEIERITTMMRDERRTKLLEWLTSVNIDTKYNDEREKHQEGTGLWLLDGSKYMNWKKCQNSLLWLHGKAGAGKSNLSATAINNLMTEFREDDEIVVAYFYFDFRDIRKQNAKAMIQSLIYQMCKRNPAMPVAVLELWEKYRHNAQAQEPGLKDDLLPALRDAIVGFKGIYIVLDGLDECPSDNGDLRTLLATLNTMYEWSVPQLHTLLTSRFILEIDEKLSPLTEIRHNVKIDLEQVDEVNDDIRKFVMAELSEHSNWSDAAKDHVATALIGKAEGMFQYVTLQLQGPLRRAKTDAQRANALKNLPRGLNETYERALLTIPEEERTHTIRSLKWLLASLRTLKITELAEASRIDLDADTILEEGTELDTAMSVWDMLPPGLVTFDGEKAERTINFAHSSFSEYLRSSTLEQSQNDAKVFFTSQAIATVYVLECCMAYQIHATRTKGPADERRKLHSKFPLWDYAAKSWMRHVESIPYEYWTTTYPRLSELTDVILQDDPDTYLEDMVRMAGPGNDDWVEKLALVKGGNALYYVALCGYQQVLKFLLQRKGLQINAVGERGTALLAACANGHGSIVRTLLDHGADPWLGCQTCSCALQAAMMSVNEDIVHSICSQLPKGELFDRCRDVDFLPLDLAIERDSLELVKYLVKNGIPINSQGGYFGSPLQASAFKRNLYIANYLLENGADVNAEGGQYGHALQAAACIGYEHMVKSLLDHGARVNARSGVLGYALHAGAMMGRVEVVKLLLSSGADVNAYGGKYAHALEGCAYMGHRFAAEALIKAGARINAQGGFYGNALQASVAYDRDMRNFLLNSGARFQPPGPRFEAVLDRVRALKDGEEIVADLERLQREHWSLSLSDPSPSYMQDAETGCWNVNSPADEDPWMEWWTSAPEEWKKSYEIWVPIGVDIRV